MFRRTIYLNKYLHINNLCLKCQFPYIINRYYKMIYKLSNIFHRINYIFITENQGAQRNFVWIDQYQYEFIPSIYFQLLSNK